MNWKILLQAVAVLISLFFIAGKAAGAVEYRSGNAVEVARTDTVKSSLFATGKSVTVNGRIAGDLFCVAQKVKVTGVIDGDVICAGQIVEVTGKVSGNVRVAGQTVNIEGSVDRNVTALAQTVTLGSGSKVDGEVVTGGQLIALSGYVGNGVSAGGETVNIDGSIVSDAQLWTNDLNLGQNASVSGRLTYTSESFAKIDKAATVSGNVVRLVPQVKSKSDGTGRVWPTPKESWWMGRLRSIIFWTILGIILVSLFPKFSRRILTVTNTTDSKALVTGIISMVMVPLLLILVALTLIGIPLAILGGIVWVMGLMFARLLIAFAIGERLLASFTAAKKDSLLWMIIVGVPVTWIAYGLPLVGWLLTLVAFIWGSGAIILTLKPQPAVKSRS